MTRLEMSGWKTNALLLLGLLVLAGSTIGAGAPYSEKEMPLILGIMPVLILVVLVVIFYARRTGKIIVQPS